MAMFSRFVKSNLCTSHPHSQCLLRYRVLSQVAFAGMSSGEVLAAQSFSNLKGTDTVYRYIIHIYTYIHVCICT